MGSASLSCTRYNASSGCSITAPSITRSGWTIVGWNTSSSATSSAWNVGATKTIGSDTTYYAITSKSVTVTFNGNGGTAGSSSKTCSYYNGNSSCNVTMPSASRSGYNFGGWGTSSSSSSASYSSGGSYSFSSNKTLYAVWTASCSDKSGSKEFSASNGYTGRIVWSNSCNGDGTSYFYVDAIQFMSSSYNYWYYLDGYIYVNGREILWANSKASGPHISVGWFYNDYEWYDVNQFTGAGVTVSGSTVEISFYGYNESAFYFINGNYKSGQFYISNGKTITIDIS